MLGITLPTTHHSSGAVFIAVRAVFLLALCDRVLEEALQSFVAVKPDDGDWVAACAADGALPHVERFASFDAYLDNKDALETIPVQAQMIVDALSDL